MRLRPTALTTVLTLSFLLAPAASIATAPATTPATPSPAVTNPVAEPVSPIITTRDLTRVDDEALESAPDLPATFKAEVGSNLSNTSTADTDRIVAFTDELAVPDFDLVAVTWAAGSPVQAEDIAVNVRVREDGTWTPWEQLGVTDSAPDDEDVAGHDVRAGTDPLITAGADKVQVRVDTADGQEPTDLQLTTIDPGTSAADAALAAEPAPEATTDEQTTSVPARPAIISRASWGADESFRRDILGMNTTVKSMVVHHTAGTNNYTSAGSAAQVRGIYAYHAKALGWGDVGYHFLVDKFGRIYEGRKGSITTPVKGAHAGGNNTDTMGVSAIGNYDVVAPPQAIIESIAKVTGWKLAQYGVNPAGTVTQAVGGTSGSRYPTRRTVTLPAVNAHLDTYLTACPGRYLNPKMSEIRSKAAAYARSAPSAPSTPAPVTGRDLFTTYSKTLIAAGSTGWAVRDLEKELARRGYSPGTVDTSWTTATTRAVRAFQGAAMLPLDDTVGYSDWAALGGVSYTRVVPLTGAAMIKKYGDTYLASGSFGEAVRVVQHSLNLRGYPVGTTDGHWDSTLSSALRNFQSKNGLPVDGNVQTPDWRALGGATSTPTKSATRLSGNDRYATSAKVSATYPKGVAVAYVATGANYPDALAGAALAGKKNAPVLLTKKDGLPPAVRTELARLQPKKIVILGSSGVVSTKVSKELARYATANTTGEVTRLGGSDRYATATKVSATYPKGVAVAYVAAGANFPDALAGAALAGKVNAPILLTKKDGLPPAVRTELARLQPKKIVVLGSSGAVSTKVSKELVRYSTSKNVTRIAGTDRYDTARNIAATYPTRAANAYVVAGTDFPDALAGAALAGKVNAPILLTKPSALPSPTKSALSRLDPAKLTVVGGSTAVSHAVLKSLGAYIR